MTIFDYVSATIMLVLGIGVTQLLSDAVDAFRRRQTSRLHWIPMAWAAIVFAWQMQFLWAVFELQTLQSTWSALHFLILLTLALLLFIAGSLVVPKVDDESRSALIQFQQDGRWTLIVLAVFFSLAYFTNVALFNSGFADSANLQDLALATMLVLIVFSKQTSTWIVATVLFAIASAYAIVSLSPSVYG